MCEIWRHLTARKHIVNEAHANPSEPPWAHVSNFTRPALELVVVLQKLHPVGVNKVIIGIKTQQPFDLRDFIQLKASLRVLFFFTHACRST